MPVEIDEITAARDQFKRELGLAFRSYVGAVALASGADLDDGLLNRLQGIFTDDATDCFNELMEATRQAAENAQEQYERYAGLTVESLEQLAEEEFDAGAEVDDE